MKPNKLITLLLGAGVVIGLSACGGTTRNVPPGLTQPSKTTTLSPSDILAKAKSQSETDDPFAVDGGMVVVSPTDDETSDPMQVDN